jgi:hypothetical protein
MMRGWQWALWLTLITALILISTYLDNQHCTTCTSWR